MEDKTKLEVEGNQSFWSNKPFWCQPWTIIITGLAFIALSILWPGKDFLTAIISIIVVLWWYLFLILTPRLYLSIQNSNSIEDE